MPAPRPRKPMLSVEALEPRDVPSVSFPAGANVVDVAARYGATPGDGADDTAAVQQAVTDYVGRDTILYFRDGVYDLSAPIDYSLAGRGERGVWLQGQSEAGTVFRWGDDLPVFNQFNPDGSRTTVVALDTFNGNNGNAFGNYLHDFTVEIGAGNPGAVGIQYQTNNYGSLRNVTVRSADPAKVGARGLDIIFNEPGPMLVSNLTVDGFDQGVLAGPQTYSAVFDGLTLTHQREFGFGNYRLPVSITNFTSVNSVPAYVSVSSFGWGNTVITNATFTGGAAGTYAVVNENNPAAQGPAGNVTLRNVVVGGYAGAVDDQVAGRQLAGPFLSEYSTQAALSVVPGSPPATLNLPVEATPTPADDPVENWASVTDYGANPYDELDDSAAIQRALDGGARTVYFPNPTRFNPATGQFEGGAYRVGTTLTVGGNVERVAGLYSQLRVMAPLFGSAAPLFRIVDGNRDAVQVDGFTVGTEGGGGGSFYAFGHDTTDTLVVKDFLGSGYRNAVRGGKVFIEDMTGSDLRFSGQQVWLRQINPEETVDRPKIVNDGGDLWVLGLKTEGRSTQVSTVNGGRTEVLGGNLYNVYYVPSDYPAFTTTDSSLSFSLAETNFIYGGTFNTWVRDTRGGVVRELTRQNSPIDGARLAANIGLYTDRIVDASAPAAPTDLRLTAATAGGVTLAWDAAAEPDSFVRAHRVYRDGAFIGATARGVTTFTDVGRPDGTAATYTVLAENAAGLRSGFSSPLTASTAADTTRPAVAVAVATPYRGNQVVVTFTEPLAAAAAANFVVDNGVSVTAAVLSADGTTVTLTTSTLTAGTPYTLAVSGLTDRATTPNPILPSVAAFGYRNAAGGTGLTGRYYPNNDFTGTPVVRPDATVDFDWGNGPPGVPGIGADLFSVRWTGQVEARYSELYTFTMVGDDRITLRVNGQTVISRGGYSPDEITGTIALEAGRRYDIEVTVAEDFGGAGARLWWQSASQAREIVPAAQLFPTAQYQTVVVRTGDGRGADSRYQIQDGGLTADFYDNPTFAGAPVLTRTGVGINEFWSGSPGPGVPADNFSVRWTGLVLPQFTEDYTFSALPDDVFRLWVNDQLILDRQTWSPTEVDSAPIRLTAGVPATVRVDYVETGGPGTAVLFWRSPSTVKNYPTYLPAAFPDDGASATTGTVNRLNFSFAGSMIGLRFDLAGVDLANNRIVGSSLGFTVAAPTGGELSRQSVAGVNDGTPNPLWAENGPNRARWATFPGNAGGNYSFAGAGSTALGTMVADNTGFRLNGRPDGLQFRSDELTRFLQADTDGLVSLVVKRQIPAFFGDFNVETKESGDGSRAPSLTLTLAPNVTAAPLAVDLLPASDTGTGDADDLTGRDNSGPAAALRFRVSGTTAGATVTVYVDGVAVGSAVATGDATDVLTFGTQPLADGVRAVTARQTVLGVESADSAALAVTVDTAAPAGEFAAVTPDPRTTPVPSLALTFGEAVTGLDLGDLDLTRDGAVVSLSGATLTGGGTAYTLAGLTAATTATGTYAVTVRAAGTGIADAAGNALAGPVSTAWTVASATGPRVASITRLDANPTNADAVRFAVTFTEAVTGVDADDFAFRFGGGLTEADVLTVTGSGSGYTVTATTGVGNGSLRLDVIDDDSVRGATGVRLGGTGLGNGTFRAGESYAVDRVAPRVTGISSVSPNPRRAPVDSLTVTFSEALNVATFGPSDLSLTRNGGANLIGGGVTVTQTGARTFRVDGLTALTAASGSYVFAVNAAGVADPAGNAGLNSLSRGWTRETPRVTAVERTTAGPTNAAAVTYRVTFSEAVTGLDAADVRPAASDGLTGTGVTGVTAVSGSQYLVTVSTGGGSGTLRLDFVAAGSGVADLYGNAVAADFARGQVYAVDRTPPAVRSITGVGRTTDEAVEALTVTFSEAIDPATLTVGNLFLRRDGASVDLSGVSVVLVTATTFRIDGLAGLTCDAGEYEFGVSLTGVLDRAGNGGSGGRSVRWTKTA